MNKFKKHSKTKENKNKLKSDKEKKKQELIDKIAKFCSKCGAEYTTDDIQIINSNPKHYVIHFNCPSCSTDYIANYSIPSNSINKVPINTDLNPIELTKFITSGEIVTSDDVVKVYDFLIKKSDKS